MALLTGARTPSGEASSGGWDESPGDGATRTLGSYLRFVARHAWLIGAAMCLGLVAGLTWAWLQPPIYSARALIALEPVPAYVSTSTSRRTPEVTIDTDAQLFRTPDVVTAISEAVGVDPREVPEQVLVTAAPLSRVLRVRVVASTPSAAAAGANAAAYAFVEARRDQLGALEGAPAIALAARITELRERLNAPRGRSGLTLESRYDNMRRDLEELENRFRALERIRAAPAEVFRTAVTPSEPEPMSISVPSTSGAMLGLLLAIGVGAALDRRRARRDRSAHEDGAPPLRTSGER